ncbi:transglutaminase domain-containing protein [bacterium SCSIO 12741]|nr:transglutaminase domain-containing protein [bacterium SCSIO 12741]
MKIDLWRPTALMCFVLLFSTLTLQAQKKKKIPGKIRKSYVLLAHYLTDDLKTEEEKLDTIYSWITHNIAYDYGRLSDNKCYEYESPDATLKRKRGMSSEYSRLLSFMLLEVGIEAEPIQGYIRAAAWEDSLMMCRAGHSWVGAVVDSEWRLFDPTWDAGYIGRIPIEYKKPKKKTPKIWATPGRIRRFEKRYKKRMKRYEEKVEKGPSHEKRIDFVQAPAKDWFMPENDTFLLTHLPAVKFWQLRNHPIGIDDFKKEEEELKEILGSTSDVAYDYYDVLNEHQIKGPLEKMIEVADKSYEYNPDNAGMKALNYFNYISILNNQDLKKYFKDAPEAMTIAVYSQLLAYTDTVITYSKKDMANQKKNFKLEKKMLKGSYKLAQNSNKTIGKKETKTKQKHDKCLGQIDRLKERLVSNQKKLQGYLEQIGRTYPELVNGEYEVPTDTEPVKLWQDSIREVAQVFDSLNAATAEHFQNSELKPLFYNIQEIEYLLRLSGEYIRHNNFGYNRFIHQVDSQIVLEFDSLMTSYVLLMDQELPDKTAMNLLKQMNTYTKKGKADAKVQMNEGTIVSAIKYDKYLKYLYMEEIKKVMAYQRDALRHLNWLEENFALVEDFWGKIEGQVERKEKLDEQKNTFMLEHYEHAFNRDKDLYDLMQKRAVSWKKKFKSIIEN